MSLSPPGDPSPPLAPQYLHPGAPLPTAKGPEPCLTCTDEDCREDCHKFAEWANPRFMAMEAYHARWDEEAAYEGMRRTWGSILDVYILTAREGPRCSNPINVFDFIFHLHREVIL